MVWVWGRRMWFQDQRTLRGMAVDVDRFSLRSRNTPKTKPETLHEWEKLTDSLGSGCSIHGALQSFLRFLNGHWWCHWWCALRNLACEAPRDQGGVGCHIQSICHALSETNAGHRQEDITWSQDVTGHGRSAAKFWGDPACGEEALQTRHQEAGERNELGASSDAMSSDCPVAVPKQVRCQFKRVIAWIPSSNFKPARVCRWSFLTCYDSYVHPPCWFCCICSNFWSSPELLTRSETEWKYTIRRLFRASADAFFWGAQEDLGGSVSKPCTPGEHQNSW